LGRVQFKPGKDKSYYAKINHSEHRYPLPVATDILLMSITSADSLINIRLKSNILEVKPAVYHLLISSRGLIYYSTPILVDRPYLSYKVPFSSLPIGVNQITLLDSSLIPQRDRLVFIEKDETAHLQIQINDESFPAREKTDIQITASNKNGSPVKNASLSVSVTDEQLAPTLSEYPQNIYTSLLLESDLKGHIEAPMYYFDKTNKKASEHLDLLMLTQGWSDYNWNAFLDSTPEIAFNKQFGINLTGSATQHLFNLKLKNSLLTLSMMQDDQLYYDSITTDSNGNFAIPGLVLPDSTEVAFSVPKKKNNKQTVQIQTFMPPHKVSSFINFELPQPKEIEKYQQQATNRYIDDKENNPWKYEIMLKDIIVEKIIDDIDIIDNHLRPYPKADKAVITDENDIAYPNPLFFLSRNISKVYYDGETVYIKGLGTPREQSTPLFLVDGLEVDQLTIENMPMDVVERIEMVYEPTSLIMWPHNSKAQKGGVISVFTKRLSSYDEYSGSGLHHIIRGYYQSRKFYSPKYETKGTQNQPERRTTLLWIPIINTDENGIARFSFYNTNRQTSIKISVEGITPDGKPAFLNKIYNGRK
jgi:hypothetical protein